MADISIYVTSRLTSSERRVSPQWTLEYFKSRMELITGIPPGNQTLSYYPTTNTNTIIELKDSGNTTLGEFKIIPFSRIHIDDDRPDSELDALDGELDNKEEGFVLTDEEYARKQDSVLRWKENNKLGRFDPEYQQRKQEHFEKNASLIANMEAGKRCRIINIDGERRGTIRYVGKIPEIDENYWVGLEFDEPLGKNDGAIKGVRYFTCRLNHGSFVKPSRVEVGDFPELSIFSDNDDDEL